MKKQLTYTCLIACLWTIKSNAQYNWMAAQSDKKTIFVSGSAEMEVIPDEIFLQVELRENGKKSDYYKSKKHPNIEELQKKFFKALDKNNIEESDVQFGSTNVNWSSWYYHWHYRRYTYQQRVYTLKLDADTDFMALINSLDFDGVASIKIVKTDNKDLTKFRKEVKVMAMKAAKEKATYLLESVDAKLGSIISITEVKDNKNRYNQDLNSNFRSNVSTSRGDYMGSDNSIANVEAIKLRYEINAYFEILE